MRNHEFHGLRNTPEYQAWHNMKKRCTLPSHPDYRMYGGTGIGVCPAWRNSFLAFYGDMGVRPSPQHSLDRIDPTGNYEPSNCRWATKQEQSRNRRLQKNNTSGHVGVVERGSRWMAQIRVDRKTVNIGRFVDKDDARMARESAEAQLF
jgi:hypothetical protein